MAKTNGYVGTVEVETRNVSRVWFSLTEEDSGADWVRIGPERAWFTINLETADRPMDIGKLTLIMESLRSGLAIRVSHGGAIDNFHKVHPNDSFEVDGVRILRQGLKF